MWVVDTISRTIFGRKPKEPRVDPAWVKREGGYGAPLSKVPNNGGFYQTVDPPVPVNAPRNRRIGATGTTLLAGRIANEEWNKALENEKGFGSFGKEGKYDEMRLTDPQIKRMLDLLKLPLFAAKWDFEPADESDLAKEIADFCRWNFFESINWVADTLYQATLSFDYGFMMFEALEDMVKVPRERFPNLPAVKSGRPGKAEMIDAVAFTAFDPRLPRTHWKWNPNPDRPTQLESWTQWVGFSDGEVTGLRTIPADRLLRFTNRQEGSNYQGISALRYVYKPFTLLDHYERLDAIHHERHHVGFAKVRMPANPTPDDEVRAEAIGSGASSHEKGYVALPGSKDNWDFEWCLAQGGGGSDIEVSMSRLKRDIADAILAGFMTLGNKDTGSYAMAGTQEEQYVNTMELSAAQLLHVLNTGSDGWSPRNRIVDLNYGPQSKYPRAIVKGLKSREVFKVVLPLIGQMIQNKALTPDSSIENVIREKLDLAPMTPDEAKRADDLRAQAVAAAANPPPNPGVQTSANPPAQQGANP